MIPTFNVAVSVASIRSTDEDISIRQSAVGGLHHADLGRWIFNSA